MASSKFREQVKLFYDFDKARQFGNEVDAIAHKITIPAGKAERLYHIFRDLEHVNAVAYNPRKSPATYHYIEEARGSHNQNIYYVRYSFQRPDGASRADMLQAQRQAEAYLNQKYRELGPDIGRSRG